MVPYFALHGSDYRIGYNMLSVIERGSHGGPGG
jgi:hypothetical protein